MKRGDVSTEAFKYSDAGTPKGYTCTTCGAGGVKLWREHNTFLDQQTLACAACMKLIEAIDVDVRSKNLGRHIEGRELVVPYSISNPGGIRIAAVPTEDGDSYWGFSSVPQSGVDWWNRLPSWPSEDDRKQLKLRLTAAIAGLQEKLKRVSK